MLNWVVHTFLRTGNEYAYVPHIDYESHDTTGAHYGVGGRSEGQRQASTDGAGGRHCQRGDASDDSQH